MLDQALAPAAPATESPGPQVEATPASGALKAPAPSTEEIIRRMRELSSSRRRTRAKRLSAGVSLGAGNRAVPFALHLLETVPRDASPLSLNFLGPVFRP